jgi:coatomer protein complex subunit alpha (xenin)
MGEEINVEEDADFVNVESAESGAGSSEADLWTRNSPLAADHVAAGSFESAMQLLNRQVGAVNFAPLKGRFLEVYKASKTYLPANTGLPHLVNYVRRTVEETDIRKLLPVIPRDLETLANADLQEGYAAMRANKLEDGVQIFRGILHAVLVNAVSSEAEVEQAKKIIATAREYILAMSIELERRSLDTESPENLKRSLELSAYFTIPKLEVAHRQLALMAAMKFAFANKNYSSALSFANRMLANGGSPKLLEQARKIKPQCERNPQDKIDIEFDQFAEFDICAASHTPIYGGSPSVADPFTGAKYHEQYKGTVCRISDVTEIGAPASGLRLFVPGQY